MQRGENESVSVWQKAGRQEPAFSTLRENINTDVCIVGAGINAKEWEAIFCAL